jgi:hypothetical protein
MEVELDVRRDLLDAEAGAHLLGQDLLEVHEGDGALHVTERVDVAPVDRDADTTREPIMATTR